MLSRDRMQEQRGQKLERRVVDAAEAALAQQSYVSAIDVLLGLGWLAPSHLDRWRQGRVDDLERTMQVDLQKIRLAVEALRRWAEDCGLEPSEVTYLARSRDHHTRSGSRLAVIQDSSARTGPTGSPPHSPSADEHGSPSARAARPTWSSSRPWATGPARNAVAAGICS
jgi:hypothetical protein